MAAAASMRALPVVSVMYHTTAYPAAQLVIMETAWPPQMVAMMASQRFGSSRPAALRARSMQSWKTLEDEMIN